MHFGGATSSSGADTKKGGGGGGGVHDEGLDDVHVHEDDDEEEEPWVRLTFLDRHFRIKTKPIKWVVGSGAQCAAGCGGRSLTVRSLVS